MYLAGKFPAAKAKAKTSPENQRLIMENHVRNLKQEIADLYLENLMLKKMLEHSRLIKKEESCVITSENLDQYRENAE